MGIVVTVFMLLGLLLVWPRRPLRLHGLLKKPSVVTAIGTGVLVAGSWNAFWHGLRHLGEFWGVAALVSGLLMMAAAIIALVERVDLDSSVGPPTNGGIKVAKTITLPVIAGLLGSFLLYATTLIRLNLGLSIIGS